MDEGDSTPATPEGLRERWIFHRLQLQDGSRLRLIVYGYCERTRRVLSSFITLLALLSASTGLTRDHADTRRLHSDNGPRNGFFTYTISSDYYLKAHDAVRQKETKNEETLCVVGKMLGKSVKVLRAFN